jgi:LysR family transcriptional regulator of gallate degradation
MPSSANADVLFLPPPALRSHRLPGADPVARQANTLTSCLANFRHLRAFLAVCELGNVNRAAEQLTRAKSAITRSIHELEHALGVELFERKPGGMLCNTFGRTVQHRAARALREFALGLAAVSGTRASAAELSVNFPCSIFHENRLDALIMLVDLQHMPTVAHRLGVTQPAVSRAINDLERSLEVSLFVRTSKGMTPTAAGEVFGFHARRALSELRQIEPDVGALRGNLAGRVVIGALPLGRAAVLPKALAAMLKKHPGVQVSTIEGPYELLASRLRSGEIDFIFGALRRADYVRDLVEEPLLDDTIAVVVRSGHPLTQLERPALQALATSAWVLPHPLTPARALLDAMFLSAGMDAPVPAVETSDLALLRGVMLDTDLVTAISPRQLEHEIKAGLVQVLEIPLPATHRMIGFTHRADSTPSPAAATLIDEIRSLVFQSAD